MRDMTLGRPQQQENVQWVPAERLGQQSMDGALRTWLIGKGLLTARLRAACGERFTMHVVDQWTGLISSTQKNVLRVSDTAGLFRDVEMFCGDLVWAFEQTLMPDATLCTHPWLAELGDAALAETLGDLSGVERSSYEYAWLPAEDALTARALRDAQIKPAGLWARRARVSLRGAPLLIQEVFLPALGRI